jgi:hypothetical protein
MTTNAVRLVCVDDAVLDLTSIFLATTKVRPLELLLRLYLILVTRAYLY